MRSQLVMDGFMRPHLVMDGLMGISKKLSAASGNSM